MGLQIGEIIPRKTISFPDLKNKIIVIDASNVIYQFLSSIRQPDGTPLQDKKGVTSHLSGLFYRNMNLLRQGLKLIYVFDGIMPELKHGTIKGREEIKEKAREKYEKAKSEEDIAGMGKYAKQTVKITDEMFEESKELLRAMGIQVIQAPGEAEAQCAYMTKHKEIFGVGSQDYDSLLFDARRLVQNLTLASKRKTISGWVYISPEIIELEDVFNKLQINREQLISLGILVGTDYNPGGVFRIGQKKALDIVRKFKSPVRIFKSVENLINTQENKFDWKEIFELFNKPKVKDADIKFGGINEGKVKEILINREFSESRIQSQLDKLREEKEKMKQKTLF